MTGQAMASLAPSKYKEQAFSLDRTERASEAGTLLGLWDSLEVFVRVVSLVRNVQTLTSSPPGSISEDSVHELWLSGLRT